MLESLYLAINVVVPLIVFMGIGGLVKHKKIISAHTIEEMNVLIFKVLLSTMVFFNIYQSDIKQDFDLHLLIYAMLSLIVLVTILCMFVPKYIHDRKTIPVIIQGIYRSNFVLFGLQVTASICGEGNLGMTTILISVIIPMFNVIAVILFETYRSEKVQIKKILKGIIRNPLIVASVLGLGFMALDIQLGNIVDSVLKVISQMATPMSLIMLGGAVTVEGIKKYWKYTLTVAVGRLILVPLVCLMIAVALGFRGTSLVALMVMYGSPTAVASFPMASSLGANGQLAGQIVAVTTVASIFTIFMWTYILSINGWIS